jgi:hypothetical protein
VVVPELLLFCIITDTPAMGLSILSFTTPETVMTDCVKAPFDMGIVNKKADRTLSRKFLAIAFVLILVR